MLPGAAADKNKREYDTKTALLRPDMIAGAPSVLRAVTRAQDMLEEAWLVLGDPASRGRYDEAVGLRRPCGDLDAPGGVPGSGLGPPDMGIIAEALGGDVVGGLLTLTVGWHRHADH